MNCYNFVLYFDVRAQGNVRLQRRQVNREAAPAPMPAEENQAENQVSLFAAVLHYSSITLSGQRFYVCIPSKMDAWYTVVE